MNIALLRGINLGSKNRLAMKDLVAIFQASGCTHIRTLLQSGNVVFEAEASRISSIAGEVTEAIARHYTFNVPVVTRTLSELEQIIRTNPFLKEDIDLKTLHIGFLKDYPDSSRISSLSPDRSPPDRFLIRDREIFLHLPNGMARTKLTNHYFDSRLETISTMRNWNTVAKLLEMARNG